MSGPLHHHGIVWASSVEGVSHRQNSSDSPGCFEYLWCTRILRHGGSVTSENPRTVQDDLSILGVHRYSDTGVSHEGKSSDSRGWSDHPWCTHASIHTRGVSHGIVQDDVSILGVHGYSDKGGPSHGQKSSDSPGWSEYLWCTRILRHRDQLRAEFLGQSRMF